VSYALVDLDEHRQVVAFEDAEDASTAFAELRSQMRACHA